MGPRNQKRTSRLKTWLIYAIMTATAFFPIEMFAASESDLVGTWTTSGMTPNGAQFSVTWNINNDGSGTSSSMVGMYRQSVSFRWFVTNDDVLCFVYSNGGRECGKITSIGSVAMTVASDSGANTYIRVGDQIPFGSSRTYPCNAKGCWCRAYKATSRSNPKCINCPHFSKDHDR